MNTRVAIGGNTGEMNVSAISVEPIISWRRLGEAQWENLMPACDLALFSNLSSWQL